MHAFNLNPMSIYLSISFLLALACALCRGRPCLVLLLKSLVKSIIMISGELQLDDKRRHFNNMES
jgi:hypothetical protein